MTETAGTQGEVLEFLGSPAAFGGAAPVERIDTHGACIFLAGDQALKLKRAVRYDYMDLSTPALRHTMLLRELELNAPAAPSIYRDVQPVTRGPAGLEIGGAGPVVDWVLRMNRFPAEDELLAVADRGALDDRLAEEIGRSLQRYHAEAPLRDADGARLIADILDELGRVFGEFQWVAVTARVAVWNTRVRQMHAARGPLLRERGRTGHIRRGHGDLHLHNMVLIDGHPVPFDALEFDEVLGTCDVLYDLGFLLMDLDHRGLDRAATLVLSAYLLAADGAEDGGLAALPLFLSVRAAIKAMVLLQTDAACGTPAASMAEVIAYLDEALLALTPPPPRLVAVGGLSGSGKSVLARGLAPGLGAEPGAVCLSSDATRKAAAGVAPTEHLPHTAYSPEARARIYRRLLDRARSILATGHSVILDATFTEEAWRDAVLALGSDCGVATSALWLEAPADQLARRIAARRDDISDADLEVLDHQLASDLGAMRWPSIDGSGSPAAVLAAARAELMPAAG